MDDMELQPNAKDYAYAILRGLVAEIPIAGGVASELMSLILLPPLAKRQEKWINSIAEGLVELQNKFENYQINDLSEKDSFITTVMQATQTALRNHQAEKLEALRNAVLNSSLPNAPDDDLQLMFLNFIDELTTWHLRILKLFDDPINWAKEHNIDFSDVYSGSTTIVLERAYPELATRKEFYLHILNDLSSKSLAGIPTGMMTARGMLESRTTSLGKQFLSFITRPSQLA